MNGIEFPQRTRTFGKPEGWKDEDCYGLPVSETYYLNSEDKRVPCLISCWEFTPEDIVEFQKTGKVYLSITGTGMPPVSIQAHSPFGEGWIPGPGIEFHKQLRDEKISATHDLNAALVPIVFEAIGAASMCWEKPEGAGTFQDQKAAEIAKSLIDFIVENIIR